MHVIKHSIKCVLVNLNVKIFVYKTFHITSQQRFLLLKEIIHKQTFLMGIIIFQQKNTYIF